MNNYDLILHHYEMSPFSQKIRSMLGYCKLPWGSVLSPPMPPRPNLDPLTGGYRKIPVLQIGADLFCDTRIITAELADLSNQPELDKNNCSEDLQAFVDDVDLRVFFASAGASRPLPALAAILKTSGPIGTLKFIMDRTSMMTKAKVPMPTGAKALRILKPHYQRLEEMLVENPFLHGEQPGIADFSAYHVAWFALLTGAKPFGRSADNSIQWYQRITDFGDGERTELNAQDAFTTARDNTPRELPRENKKEDKTGQEVRIAPADYGRDPVAGTLVGTTATRWIIERETEDCGKLHVHFPKSGFELS